MCWGCWKDAGSPRDDSAAVKIAAQLVAALYDVEGVGGLLHIAVDDFNLEDSHLADCRAEMEAPAGAAYMADSGSVAEHWNALVALEALTERQRYAAVALHDGYWELTGEEPAES